MLRRGRGGRGGPAVMALPSRATGRLGPQGRWSIASDESDGLREQRGRARRRTFRPAARRPPHAHDWASTPLGPQEHWPAALKVAPNRVRSNIPMVIGWGPDLLIVHNDSYGESVLGDRGPALGRSMRDTGPTIGGRPARTPTAALLRRDHLCATEARPRAKVAAERPPGSPSASKPPIDELGAIAGIFGTVTAVSSDAHRAAHPRERGRFRSSPIRARPDVGHQSRPDPQFREPRLCRLPRHHL